LYQVARFYHAHANALVKPDLTARLKDVMANPGIIHKFVKGLQPFRG